MFCKLEIDERLPSSENKWSGELGSVNLSLMHVDPQLRSELVEVRPFLPQSAWS